MSYLTGGNNHLIYRKVTHTVITEKVQDYNDVLRRYMIGSLVDQI